MNTRRDRVTATDHMQKAIVDIPLHSSIHLSNNDDDRDSQSSDLAYTNGPLSNTAQTTIKGTEGRFSQNSPSDGAPIPPDGGLKAWLQVVGCFFWWFNSWGLVNAFGVFQTFYEENLLRNQSPSQIAWIGTIQAFLLIGVGVLSGPAFDAGYFAELLWGGSILIVVGHMLTSLCHQYWQLVLAQGLVVGVGTGFLFVPSVVILPRFFTSKRALANGLSASGVSVGGTIYPIIFRQLQPRVGFGWAVRALAFVMLGTCAIAIFLTVGNKKKPSKTRILFSFEAFTHRPFALFTLGLFFVLAGLYTPTFYISSFAVQRAHTDTNLAFYMLPILNAGGVVGRILPGFLADKFGPLNILVPTLAAAAILSFGWIGATSVGSLTAVAVLYSYCSGTILALPPPTVASLCPDVRVLGTRSGTSFSVAALGLFIGNPVAGAILGGSDSFVGLQVWTGVILLVGAALMLGSRIAKTGLKIRVRA